MVRERFFAQQSVVAAGAAAVLSIPCKSATNPFSGGGGGVCPDESEATGCHVEACGHFSSEAGHIPTRRVCWQGYPALAMAPRRLVWILRLMR